MSDGKMRQSYTCRSPWLGLNRFDRHWQCQSRRRDWVAPFINVYDCCCCCCVLMYRTTKRLEHLRVGLQAGTGGTRRNKFSRWLSRMWLDSFWDHCENLFRQQRQLVKKKHQRCWYHIWQKYTSNWYQQLSPPPPPPQFLACPKSVTKFSLCWKIFIQKC